MSRLRGSARVPRLLLTLAVAVSVSACAAPGTDTNVPPDPEPGRTVTTTTTTVTTRNEASAPVSRTTGGATTMSRPPMSSRGEVTIPAGTPLALTLTTSLASDSSQIGDEVTATLRNPVFVGGRAVLPAGATFTGVVTAVDEAGRVKGRARLAFDLRTITASGVRYGAAIDPVSRLAEATKGEDATKVGIGAGAGALIGGLFGGKKGAGQGALVGGGAGTGVVLATRGRQVRLSSGTEVSTSLTAALTVRSVG